MNTIPAKPRIVRLTDPAEIGSVERNELRDIIGSKDENGNYWAYSWSVERFRAARVAADQSADV